VVFGLYMDLLAFVNILCKINLQDDDDRVKISTSLRIVSLTDLYTDWDGHIRVSVRIITPAVWQALNVILTFRNQVVHRSLAWSRATSL
jgi:hypothetical protein